MNHFYLITTLSLIFCLQSAHASYPKIKVLIGKDQKQVMLSGQDMERMLWPTKSHKVFAGAKEFLFNCDSSKKDKKIKKPIRLASIKSKTGSLKINKKLFRGEAHVQTSEGFEGCDIIMESPLDEYLATLLAKEMNAKWPIEALKAQAVAARSYAYFKIKTKQVSRTVGFETNYDLENSEKHQVSGSLLDATIKTTEASLQTKGEVLLDEKNNIVPIFFHSKCGGKTLRPDQVWDNKVSGYSSVVCPFCHEHGMKNWVRKLSSYELTKSLQKGLHKYQGIKATKAPYKIMSDHKSNSRVKMYAGDNFHVIKKSRLRAVLGRTKLPSNYFVINQNNNKFEVTGSGYGHGVGLCQFGAKELAKLGYTYKQILKHYFPKMTLKKIY